MLRSVAHWVQEGEEGMTRTGAAAATMAVRVLAREADVPFFHFPGESYDAMRPANATGRSGRCSIRIFFRP